MFGGTRDNEKRFHVATFDRKKLSLMTSRSLPSTDTVRSLTFTSKMCGASHDTVVRLVGRRRLRVTFHLRRHHRIVAKRTRSSRTKVFFRLLRLKLAQLQFSRDRFAHCAGDVDLTLTSHDGSRVDQITKRVERLFVRPKPHGTTISSMCVSGVRLSEIEHVFGRHFYAPRSFAFCVVNSLDRARTHQCTRLCVKALPTTKVEPRGTIGRRIGVPSSSIDQMFRMREPSSGTGVGVSFAKGVIVDHHRHSTF